MSDDNGFDKTEPIPAIMPSAVVNNADINVNNDKTVNYNSSKKNDDIVLHLNRKAVTTLISIIATVLITLFIASLFTLHETIEYKPDVNNGNVQTIQCDKQLKWLHVNSECRIIETNN